MKSPTGPGHAPTVVTRSPSVARAGTLGGMTDRLRPLTDRGRNWYAVCVLTIIVADDYKVRVRPPEDTLSGGVDIFVILSLLTYASVAAYILLTQPSLPRIRRVSALTFLACAYVCLLVISLVHAPYPALAIARGVQVVILLGLALVASARATRADMHRFAHGFLVLVAASVVFGLLVHMPRFPQQEYRFTWLRIHPVTAGVFAGLATMLALSYLLGDASDRPGPRWSRWVYAGLLVIVGGGLLGTQTRGALVGAAAGAIVLGGLRYRGRRRVELAVLLLLVTGVALTWGGGILAKYFARGETSAELETFSSRTGLWSLAWGAIQQQPLFGWGLGASRGIFLDETGLGGGHNALVNVAVDLGFVGAAVWLALLAVLVWAFGGLRSPALGRSAAIAPSSSRSSPSSSSMAGRSRD